jgi:DNA-binding SARP family transcriptional activator
MKFSVLGQFRVVGEDGAELHIPQPRQRALLAVLLLHANQEMSTSRLTEAIWDHHVSGVGPGALRTQVWALRKLMAPASRLHTGEHRGYQLEVHPGELDAARFGALAGQGRHALESADLTGAVSCLTQALALWGEPPLADVPATLAMGPVAQRLLDERTAARELLNEARLGLGQHAGLIPELRQSTAADPANERLWEQLMLALHRAGRTAEALVAYQQARASMQAELGLEPGHGLRQLHRRILAGDPELGHRETSATAGTGARHADQKLARGKAGPAAAQPKRRAFDGDAGHVVPRPARSSDREPVMPGQLLAATAIRALLDALEAPAERIPASLDAHVGPYRRRRVRRRYRL